MSQPQTQSLLRDGIAAAQSGGKTRARNLIRQVVGLEPENETAWLWLANVAADSAEALASLRNVLKLNPDNRHAKTGLVAAIVRAAIDAAQVKDFPLARQLLRDALEIDPNNEHALLWSAGVAVYPSESIRHLRRAIEINPNNERAKIGLAQFQDEFGTWSCPLCEAPGRESAERCPTCRAVLSLADPSAFDTPTGADETAMGRAIARLTPIATKTPGGPDAFRLGLAYLNIGQPAEAIKVFNAAATRPDSDAKWKTGVTKLAAHWRQTGANRPAKAEPAAGGPPLIFVVDDSATVRKLVTIALQGAGYRVVSFADGLQVADGIKTHGVPALAILDIAMPGLDGFQVCTILRENPVTAKVPVFFLTGKDSFLNRLRAKWAGAVDYQTKPFQPKALIEIAERHAPLPNRQAVPVSN
jgi:twitching motility two-component system response regulator PilG